MPNRSIADELTTVAGVASAVAAHAQSYGIDIVPICGALEIEPEIFQSLTARISLDRLCRLLEACALLADDEAFGLKCVDRFVPGSTGPFGYGLMTAPTVREFVRFLALHMQYATYASNLRITIDGRGACFSWSFAPAIVKRDQYVDMGVALTMQRLRDIVGLHTDLVEVDLERPRPKTPQVFRDYLTKRLRFGCRENALRIPLSILDTRNPKADARLFTLMDIQCRSMRPDADYQEGDFIDQVRRFLILRMAEQNSSLSDISPHFGISERTFQRRLAEENTSLAEIRDDLRRELSLNLLTGSELSISEICYRLGYSAPSAFTRSVTRWFGRTPSELRGRRGA
ncbi:AraC family transcriptional regulator [Ciceribacter naphthalenivorans]|uniref:AraC family transcriptional regulator n=3 Tax=Alphaproteobacteria TaxID=28211 RepID=A0A512HIR4_9HYPH|nr:AraC family transcriptional regulator [Ciceribacter naphthalenivorans]GEO85327.1 AraC family transcriptional regulator [Ciceribacter naphthalenivorans]GLR20966.1 AraC family transcriptional regulator [Ciceribacter naphthalenivorans]GLT03822.1 AraC family transcriptional regulator [Sphingomonas psychrolutea]